MESQTNEANYFEQIELADTPGFEIKDIIGDYQIITRRIERNSKINAYETQIFFNSIARACPFSNERIMMHSELSYRLEFAIDFHESKLKELADILNAA